MQILPEYKQSNLYLFYIFHVTPYYSASLRITQSFYSFYYKTRNKKTTHSLQMDPASYHTNISPHSLYPQSYQSH